MAVLCPEVHVLQLRFGGVAARTGRALCGVADPGDCGEYVGVDSGYGLPRRRYAQRDGHGTVVATAWDAAWRMERSDYGNGSWIADRGTRRGLDTRRHQSRQSGG